MQPIKSATLKLQIQAARISRAEIDADTRKFATAAKEG